MASEQCALASEQCALASEQYTLSPEHESLASFIAEGTRTAAYLSTRIKHLTPVESDLIVTELMVTGVEPILIISSGILQARHLPLFLRYSRIDVFKAWVESEIRVPELYVGGVAMHPERTVRPTVPKELRRLEETYPYVIPAIVDHLRNVSIPTFDIWPGGKDPLTLSMGLRPLPYPYDRYNDELTPLVSAVSEVKEFMELWNTFIGTTHRGISGFGMFTEDFLKRLAEQLEDLHPLTAHILYEIVDPHHIAAMPSVRANYKTWGRKILARSSLT